MLPYVFCFFLLQLAKRLDDPEERAKVEGLKNRIREHRHSGKPTEGERRARRTTSTRAHLVPRIDARLTKVELELKKLLQQKRLQKQTGTSGGDVVAGSNAPTTGTGDDATPSNASTESMALEILVAELDNVDHDGDDHELGPKEFTGSLGSLQVNEEIQVQFMNFFGVKFTTPTDSARVFSAMALTCSLSNLIGTPRILEVFADLPRYSLPACSEAAKAAKQQLRDWRNRFVKYVKIGLGCDSGDRAKGGIHCGGADPRFSQTMRDSLHYKLAMEKHALIQLKELITCEVTTATPKNDKATGKRPIQDSPDVQAADDDGDDDVSIKRMRG
jgi:hypothetical protein